MYTSSKFVHLCSKAVRSVVRSFARQKIDGSEFGYVWHSRQSQNTACSFITIYRQPIGCHLLSFPSGFPWFVSQKNRNDKSWSWTITLPSPQFQWAPFQLCPPISWTEMHRLRNWYYNFIFVPTNVRFLALASVQLIECTCRLWNVPHQSIFRDSQQPIHTSTFRG